MVCAFRVPSASQTLGLSVGGSRSSPDGTWMLANPRGDERFASPEEETGGVADGDPRRHPGPARAPLGKGARRDGDHERASGMTRSSVRARAGLRGHGAALRALAFFSGSLRHSTAAPMGEGLALCSGRIHLARVTSSPIGCAATGGVRLRGRRHAGARGAPEGDRSDARGSCTRGSRRDPSTGRSRASGALPST